MVRRGQKEFNSRIGDFAKSSSNDKKDTCKVSQTRPPTVSWARKTPTNNEKYTGKIPRDLNPTQIGNYCIFSAIIHIFSLIRTIRTNLFLLIARLNYSVSYCVRCVKFKRSLKLPKNLHKYITKEIALISVLSELHFQYYHN